MFRLSTKEEGGNTVVTVDGQISGEYLDVVEDWCNHAALKGKPVRLYLRDVSAVDDAGRSMLRRLAKKGIGITATGVYNCYLVEALHTGITGSGAPQRERHSPEGKGRQAR